MVVSSEWTDSVPVLFLLIGLRFQVGHDKGNFFRRIGTSIPFLLLKAVIRSSVVSLES